MFANQPTKAELLRVLPKLPGDSGCRLPSSCFHAFTATKGGISLVTGQPGGGGAMRYVFRRGIDLRTHNAARQRLIQLDASHRTFMLRLNTDLGGGKDYPILKGVLSISAGLVNVVGAGVIFTLTTAAIDASRQRQTVLAREGDEIWQFEQVGVSGGDIVHVLQFILVDHFRERSTQVASEWVIHESRNVVVLT